MGFLGSASGSYSCLFRDAVVIRRSSDPLRPGHRQSSQPTTQEYGMFVVVHDRVRRQLWLLTMLPFSSIISVRAAVPL